AVLTVCVREIRQALRDNPKAPQFIETVHRRGYRFIGAGRRPNKSTLAPRLQPPTSTLVGREAELEQLHTWLAKALTGERQLVFITGEPGIGKTTVVEAFLEHVATDSALWIGRGQCIAHYGAGEAYLPVLEALGRLCRGPGGERFVELLSQH